MLSTEIFFGHRSKTLHRRVFSLRSTPHSEASTKSKRAPVGCRFFIRARGVVLEFCKMPGFVFSLHFAKFFGHRSKTLHRRVFSLRSTPIPKPPPKRRAPPMAVLFFLVEARGVEPLSENLLIQLSPSAFRLLDFPLIGGGGQPSLAGSHLMRDALDGERRVHVHRLLDAQSRAAILSGGTGGVITPRHCR